MKLKYISDYYYEQSFYFLRINRPETVLQIVLHGWRVSDGLKIIFKQIPDNGT